jgi:hypothetical protein
MVAEVSRGYWFSSHMPPLGNIHAAFEAGILIGADVKTRRARYH